MEIFSALLAICTGNSPAPVNSPLKGQWRGALVFSLICVWINGWVNNREAGDLRRYRAHYEVIVMDMTNCKHTLFQPHWITRRTRCGLQLKSDMEYRDLCFDALINELLWNHRHIIFGFNFISINLHSPGYPGIFGCCFFVKLFVCDTNHSDTHILFQRSWHIWKFVKMYVDILLVRKLEHIYLFII